MACLIWHCMCYVAPVFVCIVFSHHYLFSVGNMIWICVCRRNVLYEQWECCWCSGFSWVLCNYMKRWIIGSCWFCYTTVLSLPPWSFDVCACRQVLSGVHAFVLYSYMCVYLFVFVQGEGIKKPNQRQVHSVDGLGGHCECCVYGWILIISHWYGPFRQYATVNTLYYWIPTFLYYSVWVHHCMWKSQAFM